ncbi:hypothetical protein AUC69_15450 [Methyloceanibacter superfactus]|uniref:Uncharacterized protein n=1 Tax=Methyloceanibacter superfactus TaxID=1774969 RepID=A0A1E3VRK8_9HYPH|nr:hypothetical protein [Methyloceanibacter superfactus]ODR96160.1 hypothetical protein AUC69_15450 [Methyloceanibacter superfactus]
MLVAQHQPVRVEQKEVAEQIVGNGDGEQAEQDKIDRPSGSAALDALLVRDVVGTETLPKGLHGYLRTL